MASFTEKINEKEGQRRRRFLEFLRSFPMPDGQFDTKTKQWIPNKKRKK